MKGSNIRYIKSLICDVSRRTTMEIKYFEITESDEASKNNFYLTSTEE